jgi:hypothetical protein
MIHKKLYYYCAECKTMFSNEQLKAFASLGDDSLKVVGIKTPTEQYCFKHHRERMKKTYIEESKGKVHCVFGVEHICLLTNDKFSWLLEVDNQKICFQGSHHADYFANHYRKLGYKIKWNKNKWKD